MLHYNSLSEQCYDSEPVQRQFPEHADPVHFLAASTAADAFGIIATGSHSVPNATSVAAFCRWQLQTGAVPEAAGPKFWQSEVKVIREPRLHDWGSLNVPSETS